MRAAQIEQKKTAYAALAQARPVGEHGRIYEDLLRTVSRVHVGRGDTVLDLGAHVGEHTVPFAELVGPSGRVHAFEPLPVALIHLRRALAKAGVEDRVTIHETAVSDGAREATYFIQDGALGMSGLVERIPDAIRERVTTTAITVPVQRIDEIVPAEGITRLSFVKADVEGAEYHAFKGAERLLLRYRPILAFENGRGQSAQDYAYSREDFFGLFKKFGYGLYDVLGFKFGPDDWHVRGAPWYYFALPKEQHPLAGSVEAAIDAYLYDQGLSEVC